MYESGEKEVPPMDKGFKIGLVVGIFAIAIAIFEGSQNGRYQYSGSGDQGAIVDTRTGEFWTADGSHFEPRAARITAHHPQVEDATVNDDRADKLHNCLMSGADPKKCLAEFTASGTNASSPASASTPPAEKQ
jgi:hypothetical protein